MAHTKGPWEIGYGNGITGPTTSVVPVGMSPSDVDKFQLVTTRDIDQRSCAKALGIPEAEWDKSIYNSVIALLPIRENGEDNSALLAAAPDMYEALEEVEWSGRNKQGWRKCPRCLGLEGEGHASNCKLGNALKKARGQNDN